MPSDRANELAEALANELRDPTENEGEGVRLVFEVDRDWEGMGWIQTEVFEFESIYTLDESQGENDD